MFFDDERDRDQTIAAVRAGRDVYGLDLWRAESALDVELWRPRYAVFAHDDEMAEVERRAAVHHGAGDAIEEARQRRGPSFAGGWIDEATGELVLAFTELEGPAALAENLDAELQESVRFEVHDHTELELQELRAHIESDLRGPRGFTPGVGFVGVHPAENAVMVGVIDGPEAATAFDAIEAARSRRPQGNVVAIPMEEPTLQSRAEAGSRLDLYPLPPPQPWGQHCTSTASGRTWFAGQWFYYLITAGHCRDGNAQEPNAREFSHGGTHGMPLWQWWYAGSADVGRVWCPLTK